MAKLAFARVTDSAHCTMESIRTAPRSPQGCLRIQVAFDELGDEVEQWSHSQCAMVADALLHWASLSPFHEAARALVIAGDLLCRHHTNRDRALTCYDTALRCDAANASAVDRMTDRMLAERTEHRIEPLWQKHLSAVCNDQEQDATARADAWRRLAQLRAQRLGELDLAIDALSHAVGEVNDPAYLSELAELYVRRDDIGDRGRAADLYFELASVFEGAARTAALERALRHDPGHEQARRALRSESSGVRRLHTLAPTLPADGLETSPSGTILLEPPQVEPGTWARHWPLIVGSLIGASGLLSAVLG